VVKKGRRSLLESKNVRSSLVAVTFAVYLSHTHTSDIIIPFMGMDKTVSLGWLFVPFVVLVLIASTNAVNITDGLTDLQQE